MPQRTMPLRARQGQVVKLQFVPLVPVWTWMNMLEASKPQVYANTLWQNRKGYFLAHIRF
jgi:hypothetical protein